MTSDRNKLNQDIGISEGNISLLDKQITELSAELTDSDKSLVACEEVIKLGPQVAKLKNLNNTLTDITNTTNTINTLTASTEREERIKQIKEIMKEIAMADERESRCITQSTQILALTQKKSSLSNQTTKDQHAVQTIDGFAELLNKQSHLTQIKQSLIDLAKERKELSKVKFQKIELNEETLNKMVSLLKEIEEINEKERCLNSIMDDDKLLLDKDEETLSLFEVCPLCNRPLHD